MSYVGNIKAKFAKRREELHTQKARNQAQKVHLKQIEQDSLNKAMETEARKQGKQKAQAQYQKATSTPLQNFGTGLAKVMNKGKTQLDKNKKNNTFDAPNKSPFTEKKGKNPFQ